MNAPAPAPHGQAQLELRRPIVSFDLETTGLDLQQDRVVELCCVKLLPSGERQTLLRRVNPGKPIARAATAVHGITDADVADQPPFAAIAAEVSEFCRGADLTGFNIERFDIPLLRAEYQRLGQTFPAPFTSVIDSCRIFFQREPRNLTAALKFYCGQELVGAHGALADATAALDVLLGQVQRYDDLPRDVYALHEYCHPRKPEWLDADGKVVWQSETAVLSFGKHKNKSLAELAQDVPDYLRWIAADSNLSSEVKALCQNALAGTFPQLDAATRAAMAGEAPATAKASQPQLEPAPVASAAPPKPRSWPSTGKGQGSLF